MKNLYWRPQRCSSRALLAVAATAILGLATVELLPAPVDDAHAGGKLAAAQLAEQSLARIRQERIERGYAVNPSLDPTGSGLIGLEMSPVTSVAGNLEAKQTSVNPNFAAAVYQMLVEAGVERGDCVAVGCSGSFPALNTAACCALETLGATPLVISSASASQYGANLPDLMWVDMERILSREGYISFHSGAASLGGFEDRAEGMSNDSREMLCEAVRRNHLPLLTSESFGEAIDQRMAAFHHMAGERPIAAYVNIGGGSVSVGRSLGKKLYDPGLNLTPPEGATDVDSVLTRFAREGTPVIHLVEAKQIAAAYGLPIAPTRPPIVGEGPLFQPLRYNRYLAAVVLVVVLLSLRAVLLTDWAARLIAVWKARRATLWGQSPAIIPEPTGAQFMA